MAEGNPILEQIKKDLEDGYSKQSIIDELKRAGLYEGEIQSFFEEEPEAEKKNSNSSSQSTSESSQEFPSDTPTETKDEESDSASTAGNTVAQFSFLDKLQQNLAINAEKTEQLHEIASRENTQTTEEDFIKFQGDDEDNRNFFEKLFGAENKLSPEQENFYGSAKGNLVKNLTLQAEVDQIKETGETKQETFARLQNKQATHYNELYSEAVPDSQHKLFNEVDNGDGTFTTVPNEVGWAELAVKFEEKEAHELELLAEKTANVTAMQSMPAGRFMHDMSTGALNIGYNFLAYIDTDRAQELQYEAGFRTQASYAVAGVSQEEQAQGLFENLQEGDWENFGKIFATQAAETIPQLAAQAAISYAAYSMGLGRVGTSIASSSFMGASTFGATYAQYNDIVDKNTQIFMALGDASVELLSEAIGGGDVQRLAGIKDAFEGMTKREIKEKLFKKGIFSTEFKNYAKRQGMDFLESGIGEGMEEFLAGLGGAIVHNIANGEEINMYEVMDGMIVGLGMGLGTGAKSSTIGLLSGGATAIGFGGIRSRYMKITQAEQKLKNQLAKETNATKRAQIASELNTLKDLKFATQNEMSQVYGKYTDEDAKSTLEANQKFRKAELDYKLAENEEAKAKAETEMREALETIKSIETNYETEIQEAQQEIKAVKNINYGENGAIEVNAETDTQGSKTLNTLKKVSKALGKPVMAYGSYAAMAEALGVDVSEVSDSNGTYNADDGTIHVMIPAALDNTAFHEGMHDIASATDPKFIKKFVDAAINSMPPELASKYLAFAQNYAKDEQYEEIFAELAADIATGALNYEGAGESVASAIMRPVLKTLQKAGFMSKKTVASFKDFSDYVNSVAQSFNKGEEIESNNPAETARRRLNKNFKQAMRPALEMNSPEEHFGVQWNPTTSAEFANMTMDEEGNFLFLHVSGKEFESLDPSKVGSNSVTSREETQQINAAMVGGVSMMYTDGGNVDVVGDKRYMLKFKPSEVYNAVQDPEGFVEKAREFRRKQGLQASDNTVYALATKYANDRGYQVVVTPWKEGAVKAQTTKRLKVTPTESFPKSNQSTWRSVKGETPMNQIYNAIRVFHDALPMGSLKDLVYPMTYKSFGDKFNRFDTPQDLIDAINSLEESENYRNEIKELQDAIDNADNKISYSERKSKNIDKVADMMLQELQNNTEGFTIDPVTGEYVSTGTVVADGKHEYKFDPNDKSVNKKAKFVGAIKRALRNPKGVVGGWMHEGMFYQDVSEVYDNEETAYRLAQERDEIGIYNVGENKYIQVRSEGGLKKQIIGSKGAENLKIDGLEKATSMSARGASAKDIKAATGWELGRDGMWKYEIPEGKLLTKESGTYKLSEVWDSPELYQAYPNLADSKIVLTAMNTAENAWFIPEDNSFEVTFKPDSKNVDKTIAHEIQHYIQFAENFAIGGNSQTVLENPSKFFSPQTMRKMEKTIALKNLHRLISLIGESLEYGEGYSQNTLSELFKNPSEIIEEFGENVHNIEKAISQFERLSENDLSELEEMWSEKTLMDGVGFMDTFKEALKDSEKLTAYNLYQRLAGEVESRNVESRRTYGDTPSNKRGLISDTEDIAKDDLIIIYPNGETYSVSEGVYTERPNVSRTTFSSNMADLSMGSLGMIVSMIEEGESDAEIKDELEYSGFSFDDRYERSFEKAKQQVIELESNVARELHEMGYSDYVGSESIEIWSLVYSEGNIIGALVDISSEDAVQPAFVYLNIGVDLNYDPANRNDHVAGLLDAIPESYSSSFEGITITDNVGTFKYGEDEVSLMADFASIRRLSSNSKGEYGIQNFKKLGSESANLKKQKARQLNEILEEQGLNTMTLEQGVEVVGSVMEWTDWYDGMSDYLQDKFGEYASDILALLAPSSMNASSAATVGLAINNVERVYKGEEPKGIGAKYAKAWLEGNDILSNKMYEFARALMGDPNGIAVDMHVYSVYKGIDGTRSPSTPKQFNDTKEFIIAVAKTMGLEPRQVQAALWAANIKKQGQEPTSYIDMFEKLFKEKGLADKIQSWRENGFTPFSEMRDEKAKALDELGIRETIQNKYPKAKFFATEPSTDPDRVLDPKLKKQLKNDVDYLESEGMSRVEVLIDLMNSMEENFAIDPASLMESWIENGEIDIEELSRRTGFDYKSIEYRDYEGIPMIFSISDQLTTGDVVNPNTGNVIDRLMGGLGFHGAHKDHAEAAWANVTDAKAVEQIERAKEVYRKNKALYDALWASGKVPHGHVLMGIVRMGNQSMESNEAVLRALQDNIASFPKKNKENAFKAFMQRINDEKSALESVVATGRTKTGKVASKLTVNGAKGTLRKINTLLGTMESFNIQTVEGLLNIEFLKSENMTIGAVGLITSNLMYGSINDIGESKSAGRAGKAPAVALLEGLDKSESSKLNINEVAKIVTEKNLENVQMRSLFMMTSVNVLDGGLVKSHHPNYPAAAKGKVIGVFKRPKSIFNLFPAMKAQGHMYAVLEAMGIMPKSSQRKRLSMALPVGQGLSTGVLQSGLEIKSNPDSNYMLDVVLNRAFKFVRVTTDTDSFNDILNQEGSEELRAANGKVYGIRLGTTIYINKEAHDGSESEMANTKIHEMGHIWTDVIQLSNKSLYNRGVELVKQTDEYQAELKKGKDEEAAVKEAMAILIGNEGQTIVEAAMKSRFDNWITAVWSYVRSKFIPSSKLSTRDIKNMTLQGFINTAVTDILGGEEMDTRNVESKLRESSPQARTGLRKQKAVDSFPDFIESDVKEIERRLKDKNQRLRNEDKEGKWWYSDNTEDATKIRQHALKSGMLSEKAADYFLNHPDADKSTTTYALLKKMRESGKLNKGVTLFDRAGELFERPNVGGFFNYTIDRAIVINGGSDKQGINDLIHTFVHEQVHYLTFFGIKDHMALQTALEVLRKAVMSSGLNRMIDYGMTDTQEFMAEAMSNPEFQKKLAEIPFKEIEEKEDGYKYVFARPDLKENLTNLWEAFLSFVSSALEKVGVKNVSTSVLAKVFELYENEIAKSEMNISQRTSPEGLFKQKMRVYEIVGQAIQDGKRKAEIIQDLREAGFTPSDAKMIYEKAVGYNIGVNQGRRAGIKEKAAEFKARRKEEREKERQEAKDFRAKAKQIMKNRKASMDMMVSEVSEYLKGKKINIKPAQLKTIMRLMSSAHRKINKTADAERQYEVMMAFINTVAKIIDKQMDAKQVEEHVKLLRDTKARQKKLLSKIKKISGTSKSPLISYINIVNNYVNIDSGLLSMESLQTLNQALIDLENTTKLVGVTKDKDGNRILGLPYIIVDGEQMLNRAGKVYFNEMFIELNTEAEQAYADMLMEKAERLAKKEGLDFAEAYGIIARQIQEKELKPMEKKLKEIAKELNLDLENPDDLETAFEAYALEQAENEQEVRKTIINEALMPLIERFSYVFESDKDMMTILGWDTNLSLESNLDVTRQRLDALDLRELKQLEFFIFDFAINGETFGLKALAASVKAKNDGSKKLQELGMRAKESKGGTSAARKAYFNLFGNTPTFFRRVFKQYSQGQVSRYMNAIGFGQLRSNMSRAERRHEQFVSRVRGMLKEKNMLDSKSQTLMQIYSLMRQKPDGVTDAAWVVYVKQSMELALANDSRLEREQKSQIIEAMSIFEDGRRGKKLTEILEELQENEDLVEAVDFLENEFRQQEPRVKEYAQRFLGMQFKEETNYLPMMFRAVGSKANSVDELIEKVENIEKALGQHSLSRANAQASATYERDVNAIKSKKRYLDLNFMSAIEKTYKENEIKTATAEDVAYISAMTSEKNEEFVKSIEDSDDRARVRKLIYNYLVNAADYQQADEILGKHGSKLAQYAMNITVVAYFGATIEQVLKQSSALMNAMMETRSMGARAVYMNTIGDIITGKSKKADWYDLIQKFPIGGRDVVMENLSIGADAKIGEKTRFEKGVELSTAALRNTDNVAAVSTWLAYYADYLISEEGMSASDIDWAEQSKNPNQDAAMFAEQMLVKDQNINTRRDKSRLNEIMRGQVGQVAKMMIMPFANFLYNKKMNLALDVQKIVIGNKEAKGEALRSVAGTALEVASFQAVAWMVLAPVYKIIGQSLFGTDDEDESWFDQEFSWAMFKRGMFLDMNPAVLPIAAMENYSIRAANLIQYALEGQDEYRYADEDFMTGFNRFERLHGMPIFKGVGRGDLGSTGFFSMMGVSGNVFQDMYLSTKNMVTLMGSKPTMQTRSGQTKYVSSDDADKMAVAEMMKMGMYAIMMGTGLYSKELSKIVKGGEKPLERKATSNLEQWIANELMDGKATSVDEMIDYLMVELEGDPEHATMKMDAIIRKAEGSTAILESVVSPENINTLRSIDSIEKSARGRAVMLHHIAETMTPDEAAQLYIDSYLYFGIKYSIESVESQIFADILKY